MNLSSLRRLLRESAHSRTAAILQSFFKTGPGQYGEGDVFLGVKIGVIQNAARQSDDLALAAVVGLLHSRYHEERMLALLILVRWFERGDVVIRKRIFDLYLSEAVFINNWDLVDLSAPKIIGAWLLDHPRKAILRRLSKSKVLWERRIAVVATFTFIRQRQFEDTLGLCERLLIDPHDLIHKACGWMLREVGKREGSLLKGFLDRHTLEMPRTMLRYAIEKLPESERQAYLHRGKPKRSRRRITGN